MSNDETEIEQLARAARMLEYHDEDAIAEDVRNFVDKRTGFQSKVLYRTKQALAYTCILGFSGVGIAAFVESAYQGAYGRALLLLVLCFVMLVIVALFYTQLDAYREYALEQAGGGDA